jgi:hypothetical protein
VDLGHFGPPILDQVSGYAGEISWSRKVRPTDQMILHDVSLSIPGEYFRSGELNVAFLFNLSDSISSVSGGIDDVILNAHSNCKYGAQKPTHQSLEPHNLITGDGGNQRLIGSTRGETTAATESVVGQLEENDGPHCSADDFPCNGGAKAYICHYSVFKGYSTYCVSEEDTDVIRFYPNDYCGPCIGGYGWHQPNAS